MKKENANEQRNHLIVKSNELIQRSRHQFTAVQQKILYYILSKIKPDQKTFAYQVFDINEFATLCGICDGGDMYVRVKDAILDLAKKAMWVKLVENDPTETIVRWIDKADINSQTGKIRLKLDDNMQPFLLELSTKYTQFQLVYPLAMKSKYSIRLYEILKSYENLNEPVVFSLDNFKNIVGAEYERWVDIRRRIVDVAKDEINALSDINIYYEVFKNGKQVNAVAFTIVPKRTFNEQIESAKKRDEVFNKPLKEKPVSTKAIEDIGWEMLLGDKANK